MVREQNTEKDHVQENTCKIL